MTKEELKQEAKERADEYTNLRPFHIGYEEGYFDGAEPREKQIQIDAEQIRALQKQNGEFTDKVKELEAQIEKMKSQYDYAFNQLCKSREILCSMLSQYRDRKEIDYSTRECGEKLLKEEVYKNGR